MSKLGSRIFIAAKKSSFKSVFKSMLRFMPGEVKQWAKKNKGYSFIYNDIKQLQPVMDKAVNYFKENNIEFGDYYEFGVYNGTSMSVFYRALKKAGLDDPRLFGFDSFEGLPPEAEFDDDGNWSPGQFKCDYDYAVVKLKENGVDMNRVTLIKGFYSESLKPELISQHNMTKASVIMVDCDMYLSARDALAFCIPLIKDKTIIFFDDWLADFEEKNIGEKLAFNEFLTANKQFKSTPFASYRHKNMEYGQVFLVENIGK